MPETFAQYADYYDLLYRDKDYERECNYVESLWRRLSRVPVHSVLNVGCGTGGHDVFLARRGYELHGLDQSKRMVEHAREKARAQSLDVHFTNEDILHFKATRRYDSVISMFATMGYLTSNADFLASMKNIRSSLIKDGLFIMDLWYGPAVLTQKPETRIKAMEFQGDPVYRLASPTLDSLRNLVEVEYVLLHPSLHLEIRELHRMRYFSVPEIEWIAALSGFRLVEALSFLSEEEPPSPSSWNMTCILTPV